MATVGEMVTEWVDKNDPPADPGLYDGARIVRAVARLGLWDAEVLEGELEVRGYTECGCDVYVIEKEIVDGQHRVIGRIGDNHSGTFAGTPVRIIVLPAKEE